MNIVYVWFENYSMFKDQEFNLDCEAKFTYNKTSKTLHSCNNEDCISGFYNDNKNKEIKFTNINAIVGKNGSGKSTFLNFLKSIFLGYNLENESLGNIILVIKVENKYLAYSNRCLNIIENSKNSISKIDLEKLKQSLEKTDLIFFSNIFDFSYEDSNKNYYNLSTNYLINSDKRKRQQLKAADYNSNPIIIHNIEETTRQLNLFQNLNSQRLFGEEIKMPNQLRISPINESISTTKEYDKKYKNHLENLNKVFDERKKYLMRAKVEENIDSHKELFLCYYRKSILTIFFEELALFLNGDHEYQFHNMDFNNEKFNSDNYDSLLYNFKRNVESLLLMEKLYNNENGVRWLESTLGILDFLENVPLKYIDKSDARNLIVNIDDEKFVKKFFELYKESVQIIPYFDFQWIGELSSGQRGLLTLFSRFFTLADKQMAKNNDFLKENIIILIDEGELYLHPEWQKKYLNRLLEFLNEIFISKKRNIQILITSHSPFIISDMLGSNVIYLEKKNGRSVVINQLENMELTFAANIYTLFSNSFFMGNGLIGEFAKAKIDSIIEKISRFHELEERDKSELKKIVNKIGEDLIREKLLTFIRLKEGEEE